MQHGLPLIDILNKPLIDLRAFGVLMNRGEFGESGLDKLTCKPHDGRIIPQWYAEKKWSEIENSIGKETEEFSRLCTWLCKELPPLLERFNKENGISK